MNLKAVLFDVDGTLSETEEAHRAAFNETFRAEGLNWHWNREQYRGLLSVAGGRERIGFSSTQTAQTCSDGKQTKTWTAGSPACTRTKRDATAKNCQGES